MNVRLQTEIFSPRQIASEVLPMVFGANQTISRQGRKFAQENHRLLILHHLMVEERRIAPDEGADETGPGADICEIGFKIEWLAFHR
jgi:hypothetical protein